MISLLLATEDTEQHCKIVSWNTMETVAVKLLQKMPRFWEKKLIKLDENMDMFQWDE